MRFFAAFIGLLLVVSLGDAALVRRRAYRNTEEILVPVAIIQDGEDINESANLKEITNVSQKKNLEPQVIIKDIAAAVVEEPNLKAVEAAEAVVQAERRIDEAIVEEEIKEAVQEEQQKETIESLVAESKLRTTLAEAPQIVAVVQSDNNEAVKEPAEAADQSEKALDYKSGEIEKQTPTQVVVIVEASNEAANDGVQQPEGAVRQATQATPTQTTTQQNFVQQLIQNSPLGQFFNQITGQNTQSQAANDDAAPAPAPTLPGVFNPVTAVQNAAQSVVNSTTQAFQGLQQFASNLGNQFQNTLSGLGGQQPNPSSGDATTARPPGPIQQLVNTFIGTPQQAQPGPTPQGPLQGLLNIFQGNNRPQGSAVSSNPEVQPAKEPEVPSTISEQPDNSSYQISNEVRDSAEGNDSFEEAVQPDEFIVVNDDASQTESDQLQEIANVPK